MRGLYPASAEQKCFLSVDWPETSKPVSNILCKGSVESGIEFRSRSCHERVPSVMTTLLAQVALMWNCSNSAVMRWPLSPWMFHVQFMEAGIPVFPKPGVLTRAVWFPSRCNSPPQWLDTANEVVLNPRVDEDAPESGFRRKEAALRPYLWSVLPALFFELVNASQTRLLPVDKGTNRNVLATVLLGDLPSQIQVWRHRGPDQNFERHKNIAMSQNNYRKSSSNSQVAVPASAKLTNKCRMQYLSSFLPTCCLDTDKRKNQFR